MIHELSVAAVHTCYDRVSPAIFPLEYGKHRFAAHLNPYDYRTAHGSARGRTTLDYQNRRIFASEWLSATVPAGASDGASNFCSPYSLNHASPLEGSTRISA